MTDRYTPEEYVAELHRQLGEVATLTGNLDDAALNWQPGPKSWSTGQCLEHLAIMNRMYIKALQNAVGNSGDQLKPREIPMQPSGWFTRTFIRYEEPPPKFRLPAPKKIAPPSALTRAVVEDFLAVQKQLADFVRKWGGADLGDLRVKDPMFPLHLTADTQLLVIAAHNRRHLWQAEQVKKNVRFLK